MYPLHDRFDVEIEELTLSEWDAAIPDDGFEVFHLPEALEIVDDYAAGDLRLFGGYRGDELVGLFPVFVRRVGFARGVVSPPPGLYVPRLGPLLMPNSPKRRKQEQLNRTFVGGVLERVDADGTFTLFGMTCGNAYGDPRPFSWADYEVDPRFSYAVPLRGASPDDVWDSFSGSLRREIRDGRALDVEIETRGVDAAREVHGATAARYEEQGMDLPVPWAFTRDLVAALGDRARVYVAVDDADGILGGVIVLYSNDAAYFWQGGTRIEHEDVSVNGLLHWRIVEDAIVDDDLPPVDRYDLGTADDERLAEYKSKFNPRLSQSYTIRSGKLAELSQRVYHRITH